MPSTGVRGSLRSLMTIIAGGTLGYLDDELWLVQSRDLNLGPATERTRELPRHLHLARVERVGTASKKGILRVGRTELVNFQSLANAPGSRKLLRPAGGKRQSSIWIDDPKSPSLSISNEMSPQHRWQVKLSGAPVGNRGIKREGALLDEGQDVEDVPAALWADYRGRNRNGNHPELKAGDLVWLEALGDVERITRADQIASIQWARWGRKGEKLLDIVRERHPQVYPDAFSPDGKVDEVTDLFGQVPARPGSGSAGPFAARLRPDNLVFENCAGNLQKVTLAPLGAPHPGCAAFYRDTGDGRIRPQAARAQQLDELAFCEQCLAHELGAGLSQIGVGVQQQVLDGLGLPFVQRSPDAVQFCAESALGSFVALQQLLSRRYDERVQLGLARSVEATTVGDRHEPLTLVGGRFVGQRAGAARAQQEKVHGGLPVGALCAGDWPSSVDTAMRCAALPASMMPFSARVQSVHSR